MRITKKRTIKALGFVEVIIAIVVVGITSAVFLTMSGRAMKDLVQIERGEYMKRIAKSGVNIAQEVATKEKAAGPTEKYFPDTEGYCFVPKGSSDDLDFRFDKAGGDFKSMPEGDPDLRDWAKTHPTTIKDAGDYFLIMCINKIDTIYDKWANVYFWVGDIHVAGERTSESDMKDVKYNAIINL